MKNKVTLSFSVQELYNSLASTGAVQDSTVLCLDVELYKNGLLHDSKSEDINLTDDTYSCTFDGIELGSIVYAKAQVNTVIELGGQTFTFQMLYGESKEITVESYSEDLTIDLVTVLEQDEIPAIKEVTVSELKSAIQNYEPGVWTIYKLKGQMTNNDYKEIINLIGRKRESWDYKDYIGLDLSGVTGLTEIDNSGWFSVFVLPADFSDYEQIYLYGNIMVPPSNPYFEYEDGVLYSKGKTALLYYPAEKEDETFEIPSTVEKIWAYAIDSDSKLKKITIPESVDYIGEAAFNSKSIESLTFKNTERWMSIQAIQDSGDISEIKDSTELENPSNYRKEQQGSPGKFFEGLLTYKVIEVTTEELEDAINSFVPVDLTVFKVTGSMSNDAFVQINQFIVQKANEEEWNEGVIVLDLTGVTDLTRIWGLAWPILKIAIPDSVTELSEDLDRISNLSDNPNYAYEDGVLYSNDKTILYAYPTQGGAESFVIPSTVTKIEKEAFWNKRNIKVITIPESVVYIAQDAFANPNITTLNFENKEDWVTLNYGELVNETDLENPANYWYHSETHTPGLCEGGIQKPEYLTVEQLKNFIQAYEGGDYSICYVKGDMSNDDYEAVIQLINTKREQDWNWWGYIGLGLSKVTGLTKVSDSGALYKLVIPDTVCEIDENSYAGNITISDSNPYFIYDDGLVTQ